MKNRIESDKKLVFFIVGMGFAFIIVGLFLLLLYRLYNEDVKEVKPVIVIGNRPSTEEVVECCVLRSLHVGCWLHVSLPVR